MQFKSIEKNGNSYKFGEEKLGVGREVARMYLKERPELIATIRAATETAMQNAITEN